VPRLEWGSEVARGVAHPACARVPGCAERLSGWWPGGDGGYSCNPTGRGRGFWRVQGVPQCTLPRTPVRAHAVHQGMHTPWCTPSMVAHAQPVRLQGCGEAALHTRARTWRSHGTRAHAHTHTRMCSRAHTPRMYGSTETAASSARASPSFSARVLRSAPQFGCMEKLSSVTSPEGWYLFHRHAMVNGLMQWLGLRAGVADELE